MSEFLKNRFGITFEEGDSSAIPTEVQRWLDSLPRGRSARCAGCGRFTSLDEQESVDCPRCYVSPLSNSRYDLRTGEVII